MFSMCLGLLAQTPGTNDGDASDTALRDAILRSAVRGDSPPGASNAGTAKPAPAASTTSVAPAVPATASPVNNPTTPAASTVVAPAVVPVPVGTPAIAAPTATPPPFTRRFRPGAGTPGSPSMAAPMTPPTMGANPVPTSAGGVQPVEEATNVIEFPSVDINTFLDVYASLVGRTILRSPTIGNPTITLKTQKPLTKTELIQAMDAVLAMNGITMLNVGVNFVKAVPEGTVGQQAAEFSTETNAAKLGNVDQYMSQIVQLKYAKPSEVVPVITPLARIPGNIFPIDSSQILIIRDYSANVKRMLELIAQIDVIAPMDYDQEVIPIKYAKAADIAAALSSLGAGTGTGIPGNTGTSLTRTGGSTFGGAGGYSPNGGGQGTLAGAGAGGAGGTGGARTASFADRLRNAVSGLGGGGAAGDIKIFGQTKIIPDERTNSLLVFADKQDMDRIKEVISKLDVVLAQVLIDAIIMEVSLDNSRDLGVSYNQVTPSSPGNYFKGIGAINNGTFLNGANFVNSGGTNGLGGLPPGLSYAASFGQDFDATVTAIANDSRINVLSRPRIQTSHAVKAELQIGDTVPYVTGTYFGGINGQASSQYQQTFVGIDLQVTPLINADGMVVMDINLNVQQLGTPVTIDGNPVPTTTQRAATATVSVKDRETIILGGFISSTVSKTHGGVPLLMDIPGLGYLFRSSSDSKQRVELVVLLRPTYLPTPESASLFAEQERNKMPGIKAAEKEWRTDAKARQQAADKIKLPDEQQ
jgi:general secretion pathway protein D